MNKPLNNFFVLATMLALVSLNSFAATPATVADNLISKAEHEVGQDPEPELSWHQKAGLTGQAQRNDNSFIRLAAVPKIESAPRVRFFAGVTTMPLRFKGTANWGQNKTYNLESVGQVWMTEIEAGAHGLIGNSSESSEGAEVLPLSRKLGWQFAAVFGFAQKSLKSELLSGETETEVRQVNWALAPAIRISFDREAKSAVLVRWEYGQSHLLQNNPDANVQWGDNHRFWSVGLGLSQSLMASLSAKLMLLSIRDLSPNENWNLSQNTYQLGLQYQW